MAIWRRAGFVVGGTVAALVVGVAVGSLWLFSGLPVTEGVVRAPGIRAAVEIQRDGDGVPAIVATNDADALFGLGWVHAQDRLWQMELQRRIGFGRLSEVLGEPTLETDRFLRTLGLGRAATSAWKHVAPAGRRRIEAYVAGINAYLAARSGALPPEFVVLGFSPEPWKPEDVLVWAKVMALNLGGNWEDELFRARLTAKVGAERAAALLPAYTANGPLIVPGAGGVSRTSPATGAPPVRADRLLALGERMKNALGGDWSAVGSNNWVVGPGRTASGKPLLAGDPHLGAQIPSIWYLARLKGGELDVVGASFPGLPGFPFGHNGRIAWAETNLGADVQDLYVEKLDSAGRSSLHNGRWHPLTVVRESIRVKGRPDPVVQMVRLTRHGPLLSDVRKESGEPLALRWVALDEKDSTVEAFLALNTSRNWQEFTAALRHFHAPIQNFLYADAAGNIGYWGAGTVPVRAAHDGALPVSGQDDTHEWRGSVPFDLLPHAYNPPAGFIATANNQPLPEGRSPLLATDWSPPYRAERIVEVLSAGRRFTVDDMARLQTDVRSAHARRLLPYLLAVRPADPQGRAALALLSRWDGTLAADSAAAAVFWAWYLEIPRALLIDELGEDLTAAYARRSGRLAKFLPKLLAENGSWCDDIRTPQRETCQDMLTAALATGLPKMTTQQGNSDPTTWRWERAHQAFFAHNPFDKVALLRPLFSRTVATGGDTFSVNVNSVSFDRPFGQYHGVSYRQIVDFADLEASRFVHTTGQSGHPLSAHYDDLVKRWLQGVYLPMRFDLGSIERSAVSRLRLVP